LRLILAKQLAPTAGLLLYGLQTAALNLKRTRFELLNQTDVVIEPRSVADNPLGEHAWHPSEFEYHDDPQEESEAEEGATRKNTTSANEPPALPIQASGIVPAPAPPLAELVELVATLVTLEKLQRTQ